MLTINTIRASAAFPRKTAVLGSFLVFAAATSPIDSIAATVHLSDHAAAPGGVPDQFSDDGGTGAENDNPYYAFTLTAMGANVTLDEVVFTLTNVSGLSPSDFSDPDFGIDSNGNLDLVSAEEVGGVTTFMATQIVRSGIPSVQLIDGQPTPFILELDVAHVALGDRFTIDLAPSGVKATIGLDAVAVTGDSASSTHVDTIPIPAAAWLFGSALGMLGWLKRRSA